MNTRADKLEEWFSKQSLKPQQMTLNTETKTFSGIGLMKFNQDRTFVHIKLNGKLFRIASINDYGTGVLSDQEPFTLGLNGIVDDVYTLETTIPKEITKTGQKRVIKSNALLSYTDTENLIKEWREYDKAVGNGVVEMRIVKWGNT